MSTIVTLTDQIADATATVPVEDIAETITPWYAGAPTEVTDAITGLQDAANAGDWTTANQHAEFLALTVTR